MTTRGGRGVIGAVVLGLGLTVASGCQTWLGGMTLPSADYQKDNPDYIPNGPQFPLPRELAAQQAAAKTLGGAAQPGGQNP